MSRSQRDEKAYVCPNCGEDVSEDARRFRCPTCGTEGYDECCFPAGNNTECLNCETRDEDDNDE